MQPANPKVFISHASEDKERFVLDFATKLYSKGIEAWVDRWEMLPGDSIIDRIFEQGIAEAQVMIVVISEHSVNKPWIREELNAGMVRKINGVSRMIPVVIGDVDDSQIPESLKTTVWERIKDLDDYDPELDGIVRSIYGQRDKPDLGDPPGYSQLRIDKVPGLREIDSYIFKLVCEELIQLGYNVMRPLASERFQEQIHAIDIDEEGFNDSIEVLENRGYFEISRVFGNQPWGIDIYSLQLRESGFDEYTRMYLPNYDSIVRSVALEIANYNRHRRDQIAASLGESEVVVDHVLRQLQRRGYLKAHEDKVGRIVYILNLTAAGKR